MRKITQLAVKNFLEFKSFKKGNTEIKVMPFSGDSYLYLYNNLIAKKHKNSGKIEITNAGFFTNVTKERLNAIPNVSIVQKSFEWFLNGKVWNGDWVEVN